MMLEFKNVSFRYAVDEFPMMENLSFSVEERDFVSIIGASGCGKSTIFRLINGLEQLQKGEILVNGKTHPRAEAIQCLYAAEGFAFSMADD